MINKNNLIKRFKPKRSIIISLMMVMMISMSGVIAFAASSTYNTYYDMQASVATSTHSASQTPTATVTTSNMTGDSSDKLWVEIDKKYWYGWASPGSGNSSVIVSSTVGSTFSLLGDGSGDYRLLFMKYSYVTSGEYNTSSPWWYSDLTITYNY